MKINFTTVGTVPSDRLRSNEYHAATRGLPSWKGAAGRRLAVVGGGPSITGHIDEIRAFDGDVWAINGAFHFLKERGIDAAFYTIDPSPLVVNLCKGASRAVLSLSCDPSVFDELSGADVVAVGHGDHPCGSTSATAVPAIAAGFGYRDIVFYGCESSYGETTHAYQSLDVPLLKIAASGGFYVTSPPMLLQAEFLAELIRVAPGFLKERSGGLLRALVVSDDYDIVAASQSIHDSMRAA